MSEEQLIRRVMSGSASLIAGAILMNGAMGAPIGYTSGGAMMVTGFIFLLAGTIFISLGLKKTSR
jgi:hypothetical protein